VGVRSNGETLYLRRGVISGDFESSAGESGLGYPNAAFLRVNQSGLDLMMDVATGMLAGEDLAAAMGGSGPLIDESRLLGSFAIMAEVSSDPGSVAIEGIELNASPTAGGLLRIDADIQNIHVKLDAEATALFIDFPNESITVDTGIVATAFASVEVVDGELVPTVGIDHGSFDLVDFSFDTSITGDLLDYLSAALIEGAVEDAILAQVDGLIASTVGDLMGQVELSIETDLMGTAVAVEAEFADAGIDDEGLWAGMDLAVTLGDGVNCPEGSGYLVAAPASPVIDKASHIGGAISDDLLNGLFLDAWCAGLLELTLTDDDPEFGFMVGLLLDPLQATSGTVTVSASLPPVWVESFGEPVLQITELLLTVDTPGRSLGEHLTVALDVTADVEISMVDNTPRVVITGADVRMMARESDWGASPEATTKLLEAAMGPMLETLPALLNVAIAGMLGGFEVPDLMGLVVEEAVVTRDAAGSHGLLSITLGVVE
jgi:hypothetical protein